VSEPSLKLTAYFGERDRTDHGLLADALLDLFGAHEVETSILLRGIGGFGHTHSLRTDQLLSLSEDLPVVCVAVDTPARIEELLPAVLGLRRRGLVTLERARLVHGAEALAPQLAEAAKLTVYVGRHERADGRPAFVAVCDLLRRLEFDGATVLLGVDGARHGERLRARFFARNAAVPVMIIAIASGPLVAAAIPELEALLQRPVMTAERVRVCKRDGLLLGAPPELPGTDEHGLPLLQKLMVYGSESAMVGGMPLHRALLARLRAAKVAGATQVRGVWGFHGDHPPHGDRLLQLRRHTPVVTVVVDTPERIAAAFAIIDELTVAGGLVTGETVPGRVAQAAA
jgi:PII-like signaling protein